MRSMSGRILKVTMQRWAPWVLDSLKVSEDSQAGRPHNGFDELERLDFLRASGFVFIGGMDGEYSVYAVLGYG